MTCVDLFARAEALAKQRAEILQWADSATLVQGFGSPRKLRRAARAIENRIAVLADCCIEQARQETDKNVTR